MLCNQSLSMQSTIPNFIASIHETIGVIYDINNGDSIDVARPKDFQFTCQ